MVVIRTRKIKFIILGIFDKIQHNRQYIRLCYKYLPGRSFKDWRYPNLNPGEIYVDIGNFPDLAAKAGHLYIIKELQKRDEYCTGQGGEWAAEKGHLHILKYLFECGMFGSTEMLVAAAKSGHLYIIQFLLQGINIAHCPYKLDKIIDAAIEFGRLDIVRFMYEQTSYNTSLDVRKFLYEKFAKYARRYNQQHIVEFFNKQKIYG